MSENIYADFQDVPRLEWSDNRIGSPRLTSTNVQQQHVICYDCPICLGTYQIIHSDFEYSAILSSEISSESATSTSRIPILREECYQLDTCKHVMCRACLSSYCKAKITDGIVNITCCYPITTSERGENSLSTRGLRDHVVSSLELSGRENDTNGIVKSHNNKNANSNIAICRVILTDHDVEQIILFSGKTLQNSEAFNLHSKYQRFKFDVLHGDSCRRCPKCDTPRIFQFRCFEGSTSTSLSSHSVEVQEELPSNDNSSSFRSCLSSMEVEQKQTQKSPLTPVVKCLECDTEFCYFHSNAHTGRTCEEYDRELEQRDEKSAEYLRKHSKCCPKCGMSVQKVEGCNQMQCPKCQTYFCWLCLKVVDDGMFPAHFQWWNLGGCPNLQMHEDEEISPRALCLTRIASFIQIIVIGLPSLILTGVTVMICPCCFFGESEQLADQRMQRCFSMWGNILTAVLLAPFIFVCAVISFLVFILRAAVKGLYLLNIKIRKYYHHCKEGLSTVELSATQKNESHLTDKAEDGLGKEHQKSSIALNDTLSSSCPSEHVPEDNDLDLKYICGGEDMERNVDDSDDKYNVPPVASDTISISSGSDDLLSTQESYTIDSCDIIYKEL